MPGVTLYARGVGSFINSLVYISDDKPITSYIIYYISELFEESAAGKKEGRKVKRVKQR